MGKIGIKNLQHYGKLGWQWDEIDKDTGKKNSYRTNRSGSGLWVWGETGYVGKKWRPAKKWKQIGGSQFSLPNDRKKAYNKLYHQVNYEYSPLF
jgi:hypothetical protein